MPIVSQDPMQPPPLFRREAVTEAAAPDRYDEALTVMRPWTWASGGALLVLAVAGIVWASVVDVPLKVNGRGILLPAGGVVDIVADTDALRANNGETSTPRKFTLEGVR